MDLRQTPAWRRLFGVALTCGACLVTVQESQAQFRRFGFPRSQPQPAPRREIDTGRSLPGEPAGGYDDENETGYARTEGAAPAVLPQERSSRGGLLGRIFGRNRSGASELPEPPPARGDRTEKKKSELLNPRDLQPIRERPVVPTLPGSVDSRGLEAPRSSREGSPRREPVAMEPAGRATISGPRTKSPPPAPLDFVPPPPTESTDGFFTDDNDADDARSLDLDGAPAPRRIESRPPQSLNRPTTRPAELPATGTPAARRIAQPAVTEPVAEEPAADDDDIAAPLSTPATATPDTDLAEEGDERDVEMNAELEGDAEGARREFDNEEDDANAPADPEASASLPEETGESAAPEGVAGPATPRTTELPTTVAESDEELESAFDSPYRSAPIETRTLESQRVNRSGTPASRVSQPQGANVPLKSANLPGGTATGSPAAANAPLIPPKTPTARESIPAPVDPTEVTNRARANDIAEVVPTPRVANPTAGMMGYCPVALKDQRELQPVRPEIQSRFGGKVYQFSTEEAREAFDANPRRYMPALNGFDVVRNSLGERQVSGSLQYAAWYRGRLYLFQSAQTLQMFVQAPTRFVEFP